MFHYNHVTMTAMASQITGVSSVCSTLGSAMDQRRHQSSASLAFVRGIHPWLVNFPHKRPVTRKMFPLDDIFMPRLGRPVMWQVLSCASFVMRRYGPPLYRSPSLIHWQDIAITMRTEWQALPIEVMLPKVSYQICKIAGCMRRECRNVYLPPLPHPPA